MQYQESHAVVLAVALVLLLSSCGNNPQTFTTDTAKFSAEPKFLIAGQSNAVSPAQEINRVYSISGKVRINDYYDGNEFRTPTVESPMEGGVTWVMLGDLMNRPVTINNIAIGNQTTRKWATTHIARMMDALEKDKYDAVLWVQGESDVVEHISGEETYQNMKYIIERSRERQPGLRWYVAINSHKMAGPDNETRRAQQRIIAERLAFAGPDTDKLRDNPTWMETGFGEFVADGLVEHARMWFEVLKDRL